MKTNNEQLKKQTENLTQHMLRVEKIFPSNVQLIEPSYTISDLVRLLNGKRNILFKAGMDEPAKSKKLGAIKATLRNYLNEVTPEDEIEKTDSGRNTKYPSTYIQQILNGEKCRRYLRVQARLVDNEETIRLNNAAKDVRDIASTNPTQEYDPAQDPSMVKITIPGPPFIEYYAVADGGFGDYLKEVLPEYKQRIINNFILEHFITIDEQSLCADLEEEFVSCDMDMTPDALDAIKALENTKNYYEVNTELLQALSIVSKLSPNILELIIKASKMKSRDK